MNLFQFDSRIDFFQCDSKNWIWLKGLNLYFPNMTQRIEPSFSTWFDELNPFLTWLKDLNAFFLFDVTQRIEPFTFRCDSKNWTLFLIWLKELNLMKMWLKELNSFFFNVAQRIELFFDNMAQRIELFFSS